MSQKLHKDVKSGGNVVATIEIEQFDNLDEAESTLGEEACVGLINRMYTIEKMDEARRAATGGTATGARAVASKLKDAPDEVRKQILDLLGIEL